jgi:hypothetical protein
MPSEREPPRIGTATIKDLFIVWRMVSVLTTSTAKKTRKIIHSLFENSEMAVFSSFFLGNFKLSIQLKYFYREKVSDSFK